MSVLFGSVSIAVYELTIPLDWLRDKAGHATVRDCDVRVTTAGAEGAGGTAENKHISEDLVTQIVISEH